MITIKVAILIGGTFNPITIAHVQLGIKVQEVFPDADIIYVPSNMHYIKNWKDISKLDSSISELREDLIDAALKDTNFIIDNREMLGQLSGKTYDLVMDYLDRGYDKVYFCVGFDKIDEIPRWYKADELFEKTNLILFSRDNCGIFDINNDFYTNKINNITFIKMSVEYQNVSSTMIRDAYNNNDLQSVENMLPADVYNLLNERIKQHGI